MMKHEYQDLMRGIHAPEEWNEQILATARQGAVPAVRQKTYPLLRAAVCAVLAVLLVVGGVRLRPTKKTLEQTGNTPLTYEVVLAACAAGLGANGGVLLETPEGYDLEDLNGTTQTLSLTFADGREETGIYHLQTEKLRTFVKEDGGEVLVPALKGETAETISGIYAVPAEESCWFQWPVEGSDTVSLSNPFGPRWQPGGKTAVYHSGIDIPAEPGTPVTAAAAGTVVKAEFDADKGNYIALDHGDGMETVYAQCLSLAVAVGDSVEAGQIIAAVGSTGKSTGPHLCFQVWQDGEAQNPVAYFNSDIRDTLKMG